MLDAIRNGKAPEDVKRDLMQRGWPAAAARHFVDNAQKRDANESNSLHTMPRDKDRAFIDLEKRRRNALWWMIAGVALACMAYPLAGNPLTELAPAGIVVVALIDFIAASRQQP